MANPTVGYKTGVRVPVLKAVDSTSADIVVGDFVVAATAGYIEQASAGELPLGVAMQAVDSPSADGDVSILVDVSRDTVYAYPPDAGTVTQGLAGTTMDIGGAQSINIDASADDIVICHYVDTDENLAYVSLIPTNAGVA